MQRQALLVDWPELVTGLLTPGSGTAALTAAVEAAAGAAHAEGVELVEWVRDSPTGLAVHGVRVPLSGRPAAGAEVVADRPVAVVRVDDHRDLIAVREPGAEQFDPHALAALGAVATLVGRAGVVGRAEATETLSRLSLEIVGSLELDRVLLSIVHTAAQLLASEVCGVFLASGPPEARELRMRCVIGHHTPETARLRIPSGRGMAGKVLATGRPARVDQYRTAETITKDYLSIAIEEGTQSGLGVPMRDGAGEIIGVLAAWRLRPSVYSDEDEALLVSLARLAAIGLVNGRRYQQQEQATAQVEAARAELERRLEISDEALDIHRRLTRIAAEGLDLAGLAEAVRNFVGGTVVIAPDGDRSAVQWPPQQPGDHPAHPREREARPAREALREGARGRGGDPEWVRVPIEVAGVRHGLLYARLPTPAGLRDVVTLEQSATICALLLGHEASLEATTARLRAEFVRDLLAGRVTADDTAVRAGALGLRIGYPARVMAVAAEGLDALARAEQWSAEQYEHNRGWLATRVAAALGELVGHDVPIATRAEELLAILPATVATGAVGGAVARCSPFPVVTLRVGVSAAADAPGALPQALHEARVARSAVAEATGPIVAFDDLGVLRLLLGPGGGDELHRYAEGVLGHLLAYDHKHGTDLVATLDAFFEHDANAAQTARALRLHPKSLAYRLRRIGEVGGLDLADRGTRLDVELALRILGPVQALRRASEPT